MRKVTLNVANSLDHYIARPDGSFDWIFNDQDYGEADLFHTFDTVIMGRKMHDLMVSMGAPSFQGMRNLVVSREKSGEGAGGVEYVSGDVRKLIGTLRAQPGKGIWLAGGGELVHTFLKEQLIDEFVLAVHPILLGQGITLFQSPFPETRLKLEDCKMFPTGLLFLTYSVIRDAEAGLGETV